MTSRDFAYFMQGIFEIAQLQELNQTQTELVKRHLALVFKHEIDPSMGDEKHQEELNKIHSGKGPKLSSGSTKDASGQTIYRC